MKSLGLISGYDSLVTFICVAGVLVAAFVGYLFYDSYQRSRRRRKHPMGRDQYSDLNPVSRWLLRTRHTVRRLQQSRERHRRAKAAHSRLR